MPDLATIQPPLVAILRGLAPADAARVGTILIDAGFRLLEVPLNRPGALDAIAAIKAIAPAGALVGGGTMLTVKDVDDVAAAGGVLASSPNCDPDVIRRAVQRGMIALPGIMTPSEAFLALKSGAHGLKLFPAETLPPAYLKALRSVLPAAVPVYPVGGIRPETMADYVKAGASGFGIGGQLFRPGVDDATLRTTAEAFVSAWRGLSPAA